MSPNELLEDLRQRPFQPFRMEVSDGSHYDIYHPELCMVGMSSVIVGVVPQPDALLYSHAVRIDCRHIVKTYHLPPAQAPANGQESGPTS